MLFASALDEERRLSLPALIPPHQRPLRIRVDKERLGIARGGAPKCALKVDLPGAAFLGRYQDHMHSGVPASALQACR